MAKKGLLMLFSVLILITFSSCGLDYRYGLDENLHERIKVERDGNKPSYLIYQGDRYVYAEETCFTLFNTGSYRNDTLLSWNGSRYFWYIDEYYSDTAEKPWFIYNERLYQVFLREDYDCQIDTFQLEDSAGEILWKNIFGEKRDSFDFINPISVTLRSKTCSRIEATITLENRQGQWYLSLRNSEEIWTASEEFIQALSENGLI